MSIVTMSANAVDPSAPQSPLSLHSATSRSTQHSDTSTIRYCQEPWTAYIQRVETLCQVLWPPQSSLKLRILNNHAFETLRSNKYVRALLPSSKAVLIERIGGGDYNRIIGLTLKQTWNEPERQLILRVPRDLAFSRPDRDAALLQYISQRSSIPIPSVFAYDSTSNNALESPYVLQHRIPGSDLAQMWNLLNHTQKCTIARKIGDVVHTLLAMESPIAGIMEASDADQREPQIIPFELKNALGEIEDEPEMSAVYAIRPQNPTANLLQTQMHRWRGIELDSNDGEPDESAELWNSMLNTIREMNETGFFEPASMNCLCHVDLQPRNIMAKILLDGSADVTAILDWDEAVFAPKFVNCRPPWWIWGRSDNDLIDVDGFERCGANDVPHTPEHRELKCIFEESAGSEYVRLAYNEVFRLCRGLFSIATQGLRSSEQYNAARRIVDEWEVLRNTRSAAKQSSSIAVC